ncbi:MAG: BCD family MFS transporter [Chloroflexota bacterium]
MQTVFRKGLDFLLAAIKTLRLALPKLGVGWMFALLTINFNRITITELNVTAVAVTGMLALHYFLSPFQVITGRIADQNPILGMRRTPYLLTGGILGSLVFLALPSVALGMGNGNTLAFVGGFALFFIFGACIAVMGDSHHSLIADVIEPRRRGTVIAVVWTFSIMSTIIAAGVMTSMMPEYSPEAMQQLYNLTPFIVVISILVGVVGIEKRFTPEEAEVAIANAQAITPSGNPLVVAVKVLRENPQAMGFFAFVFISIFSIFLQDNILEPFGAEVFGMSLSETNSFQPKWGGGVLIGMMVMGLLSGFFNISKRMIVIIGCVGTAAGMGALATGALTMQVGWITPSLIMMGFFTGFFNVGALSMMMDMTIEGATGLYMGLWGVAQAFGNGTASFGGGALHTGLIETGLLAPNAAYCFIFSIEASGMLIAAILIWNLSVDRFQVAHKSSITKRDAIRAMEVGAVS